MDQTRKHLLVLTLIALVLTLPWIWNRPFFTRGEPREAIVSQAMERSGDYIVPRRYGDTLATKPPMAHWLMAASSKAFGGLSPGAYRFPAAMLSVLVALGLYLLVVRRRDPKIALYTCLILLGCLEWHRASTTCRVDMVLSAFMFFTFFFLYEWYERKLDGVPVLAIVFAVAATLTKGPVAIVLPTAAFGLFLLSQQVEFLRATFKSLMFFVPVVAVASVWYSLAIQRGGDVFLEIVYFENIGRFLGKMRVGDPPHTHSAFYLYVTLLAGFLPWTVGWAGRTLKEIPRFVASKRRIVTWWAHRTELERYSWIIAAVFIVFYSIPASKRSVYLLPAYPFIAYLGAEWVVGRLRAGVSFDWFFKLLCWVIIIASPVLVLFASGVVDLSLLASNEKRLASILFYQKMFHEALFLNAGLVAIAVPTLLAVYSLMQNKFSLKKISVATYFAFLVAINAAILPAIAGNLSARSFGSAVKVAIGESGPLSSYGDHIYGAAFYLDNALPELDPDSCAGYVVVRVADLGSLDSKLPAWCTFTPVVKSPNGIRRHTRYVMLVKLSALA